ncbi:MAG: hypothetical protein COX49_09870 [bacterium (Candidatus Stahlbacteria) CG23_combo_of_CG06-09_8_20_14_all_40_9]|nr:MAG: hypothetical protein COX49_09870 [bacterium (Candidatus Stahlbacteria) CG23_combo_of_CG06-09_8_20_14_all_40_9]
MRRFLIYIVPFLFLTSCHKPSEERKIYFDKKEKLDGVIGFVTDTHGVRRYDLFSYSLTGSIEVDNPKDILFYNDSVFIHNSYLYRYDIANNRKEIIKKLHPTTSGVILTDAGIYSINEGGILYDDEWLFKDSIIEYRDGHKNIWLLTPHSVVIIDKKEKTKRIKEMDNPITFCISPYGLRIYVAFNNRIEVYSEKQLSIVKSIPIDDTPINLVTTPAGNKIYILSASALYVLNRSTYNIDKRISLSVRPFFMKLSRDGSYGVITSSDRLLIFDAGTDLLLKEIPLSCNMVETSPLDSRIYVLTDKGMAVIRSDSLIVERSVDIRGEGIFIPGFLVRRQEPEEEYIPTSVDTTARLFAIQVSSTRGKKSAQQLVDRLVEAGYPAYIVNGEDWFRIRVGAFREKADALLIGGKVDELTKEKSWVLETDILLNELPSLFIRDIDDNGYMEEACVSDGREIVIFELRNGIYERIYTITGYLEKYTGNSAFFDIDGDDNIEIVTPTLESGMYSVVRYRDGRWVEEMERFE